MHAQRNMTARNFYWIDYFLRILSNLRFAAKFKPTQNNLEKEKTVSKKEHVSKKKVFFKQNSMRMKTFKNKKVTIMPLFKKLDLTKFC